MIVEFTIISSRRQNQFQVEMVVVYLAISGYLLTLGTTANFY